MSYSRAFRNCLIGSILIVAGFAATVFADPPGRVARIAFLSGPVSFRPGTLDDWATPPLNYPLTTGDNLWTDAGGQAELQMGAATLRLAQETSLTILNIDDGVTQLRIAQGVASLTVRALQPNEILEVDLPDGAVSILSPGFYRFDVPEDRSVLTVRHGQAQVTAGPLYSTIFDSQSVVMTGDGGSNATVQLQPPPLPDQWEDWCQARDRREANAVSARYVSQDIPGYEDLDEYGVWQTVPAYGAVWVPRVNPGWAPYRYGHWAWIEPWGWTWVDDAPWGYAPFHYGRWALVNGVWVWVPGAVRARPVYAPALVAFVGGTEIVVSPVGGAPVGWFPLGPAEPFVPAYVVGPTYIQVINAPHVQVTTVDVARITYVNRGLPGATTIVSTETFVQGRPVGTALVTSVSIDVIRRAPVSVAVQVAPVQASVIGVAAPRPGPPAAVVNRVVVVKTTPPPPPVSFAVRQQALLAHPGRPVDEQTLRTLQAQHPAAVPSIRTAGAPTRPPVPRPPTSGATSSQPAPGNLAERHAAEQSDLQTRHTAEQAQLKAKQQEELNKAQDPQTRQQLQQKHAQENKDLEQRHATEKKQLDQKQDTERKQP